MAKLRKPPARKSAARRSPAKKRGARPYHHGDLRKQLIAATEALILERGVDGFSLREVARRAGVSPAAPAHHFGDTKGLLTEVAKLGFADFADALQQADLRGGDDPKKRLHEQGIAYVTFAMRNPARFTLMFRQGTFDATNVELGAVAGRSFEVLAGAVRAAKGLNPGAELPPDGYGMLLAVWSLVHGFSHLALGGQLDFAAQMRGGKATILETFLPLTLHYLEKM